MLEEKPDEEQGEEPGEETEAELDEKLDGKNGITPDGGDRRVAERGLTVLESQRAQIRQWLVLLLLLQLGSDCQSLCGGGYAT